MKATAQPSFYRPKPSVPNGFTLVELMITVAIIGVIAAIGLPAYRGYIDTANMTKVNATYNEAIRLAQYEFSKDTTAITLGMGSTLPTSESAWIAVFDTSTVALAPGGGPAYIPGKLKAKDGATGAVGVKYDSKKQRVEIYRPYYLTLVGYKAKVTHDSVKIDPYD